MLVESLYKKNKAYIRRIRAFSKKCRNPYVSMLSLIFCKINPQITDGFLDFFDFNGNRLGEFLLVLDDFIDKEL